MVNELPNVANIDLLKAPEFLTQLCNHFFNDKKGESIPLILRHKINKDGSKRDLKGEEAEANRIINLEGLRERDAKLNRKYEEALEQNKKEKKQ